MFDSSSVVSLAKTKLNHPFTILIILVAALGALIVPICIWGGQMYVIVTLLALLTITIFFILLHFNWFARKNPSLLRSEEHIYNMAALGRAPSSSNGEHTTIDVTAINEQIQSGPANQVDRENGTSES